MVRAARVGLTLLLACTGASAWAHGAIKGIGDFGGGFFHPWVEPAHLVALVALSLLIGQRGVMQAQGGWMALSAAVAVGLLGAGRGWVPRSEDLVLLAAAATGLAVMVARPLPGAAYVLLGGLIGLGIGLGTEPEGLKGSARWASLAGTWLGASLCTLSAATFVSESKRPWMAILIRVAGSWMTACAVLVLALRASGRG